MSDTDVLILNEGNWWDDYSQQKYLLIILTLTKNNVSFIDVFMLAASRLCKRGEFILRFERGLPSHEKLLDAAGIYDFKLITNRQKLATQYVFRFDGRVTKSGYQMALTSNYSESCRSLFKEVFNHTISTEFWSWKYPKDKNVSSVVALNGDEVVAHYGLCHRNAIYNGLELGFAQACDVMVTPSSRGAMSSSVFYELVKLGEKPFYAENSPVSVIYGFPHGRHYKLGARLKLYEPISPIMEVVYQFDRLDNTFNSALDDALDNTALNNCALDNITQSEVGPTLKQGVESALSIMKGSKDTLLLARSYLYILQRYVYHPEFKYQIYCVDSCYFVIKQAGKKILLMDYLGELVFYPQRLMLLVSFLAERFPGYSLNLWCLEDVSTTFIAPDKVVDTGAVFVCKKYSSNLPNFNRWWISMGDTEFM